MRASGANRPELLLDVLFVIVCVLTDGFVLRIEIGVGAYSLVTETSLTLMAFRISP